MSDMNIIVQVSLSVIKTRKQRKNNLCHLGMTRKRPCTFYSCTLAKVVDLNALGLTDLIHQKYLSVETRI